MGFLDNARQNSQEVKEAVNNKAQEYANLSAQIENLTSTVSDLRKTLYETKKDMAEVKNLGESVVEPIKSNIQSISKELTEVENAVHIATNKIRDTEYSSIDWKGILIYALFTAIFFVLIISPIQYYIFDIGDIKKDIAFIKERSIIIHYNQTTGSGYGQYDPWHISEFWDNFWEVDKKNKHKQK